MALADKVPAILDHVKAHKKYLAKNAETLDIFDGNLLPYVMAVLQSSLTPVYFDKIKDRIVPINVLKRITDKISQVYINNPIRQVADNYSDDLKFYEQAFGMNGLMQKADNYSNLFKGYALEPFVHLGKPRLRVLPYERFIPYSDDSVDPTFITVFVKLMGQVKVGMVTRDLLFLYSDEEFLAITDDGKPYGAAMAGNDGVNPYGVIPFYYGNRGNDKLVPTQDTDILALTKLLPTLLTDTAGALMFQCFSIIFGIDLNAENMTVSPNAFWNLKSDKTSGTPPVLGTLKPEVDSEKVITFVMTVFSLWLETRGIRVGSMGSLNSGNLASGISKIIDEMDTSQLVQKSMGSFSTDEAGFWNMLAPVQNYWVTTNQLSTQYRPGIWREDFLVNIQFDDPQPIVDRKTEVETVKLEQDAGYLDHKSAMARLYPDLTPEQIDERIAQIEKERQVIVEPAEPEDQEAQEDNA